MELRLWLLGLRSGPLERPTQQRRSHGEPGAHRRQHHEASLLQLALFQGGIHRQRDRPCRGVSVAFDVHDYGLGANIYTSNLTWAMQAMTEIKAGTFWINDPLTDNDAAPFGGMRKSGMGRELGEEGLDAFRETKHIHMDFVPERKTYWFPYRERASEIPG